MFQNKIIWVLILILIFVTGTVSAQTIMKVGQKTDSSSYSLSQISKISFNKGFMIVENKSGGSKNYIESLIKRITFNKPVIISSNDEVSVENKKDILSISPNPASTDISITFNEIKNQSAIVTLYDSRGVIVLKQTYPNGIGQQVLTLDISNLYKGMYILRIDGEIYSESAKFIKI